MSSWTPRDLSAAWRGEGIVAPSVCWITGSHALFYQGRINGLHGEPESGKSWIAWITARQILDRGGKVLYLDTEDSEIGAVTRLQALGVTEDMLDRFGYVRPEEPCPPQAWGRLLDTGWDLLVVDSVMEAMGLEGLDPLDNAETAMWLRKVVRPASDRGITVIMIDHVAKNRETRGTWAIGAQQKRAMIRGSSFMVELLKPFAKGGEGEAALWLAKDTPGEIRARMSGNGPVARLHLVSDETTGVLRWWFTVPTGGGSEVIRERIRGLLLAEPGASKRMLRRVGSSEMVDQVLGEMIMEGLVRVERQGVTHAHWWVG